MTTNKYDRFNHALLFSPKYTSAQTLHKLILNGLDATYNYIIDLRYRDLLEESCRKRQLALEAEKKNLDDLLADLEQALS